MAEYPEDTTNYRADEDILVQREHQQDIWRREQDANASSPQEVLDQATEQVQEMVGGPDYSEDIFQQNVEALTVERKSFAIQSVVQAQTFEDFDDLMNKAKQVYSWMTEEPEATGASESAQEEPA